MKKKRYMKPHLIDVTFAAEDITTAQGDLISSQASIAPGLRVLEDSQRNRVQHLGTRNETFSRAAIELARQYPQIIPAGIDMAALERDLVARDQILPLLLRSRQYTRMLEDTFALLGVDLFNGARGIYKSAQIVGDLYGIADTVEQLGEHFARSGSSTATPPPETPETTA